MVAKSRDFDTELLSGLSRHLGQGSAGLDQLFPVKKKKVVPFRRGTVEWAGAVLKKEGMITDSSFRKQMFDKDPEHGVILQRFQEKYGVGNWYLVEGNTERAEEVFLTNSLMEIMPVCDIAGEKIPGNVPGEITAELATDYKRVVAEECGGCERPNTADRPP